MATYKEVVILKERYFQFLISASDLGKKEDYSLEKAKKRLDLLAGLPILMGTGNVLLGELNFQISLDMIFYQACKLYLDKSGIIEGSTKIFSDMTLTSEEERLFNNFKDWFSKVEAQFKME